MSSIKITAIIASIFLLASCPTPASALDEDAELQADFARKCVPVVLSYGLHDDVQFCTEWAKLPGICSFVWEQDSEQRVVYRMMKKRASDICG